MATGSWRVRQLLDSVDEDLLALEWDELLGLLPVKSHSEVRLLLGAAGAFDTPDLNSFLQQPKASAVLGALTNTGWHDLRKALLEAARSLERTPRQPRGDEPPYPPKEHRQVEAWLEAHGDPAWMDLSIEVLGPWLDRFHVRHLVEDSPNATLQDCLTGWGMGSRSRLHWYRKELLEATRQHLAYLAQRRREERAREVLWAEPLEDPQLSETVEWLKAHLAHVKSHPACMTPVRYVRASITLYDVPAGVGVRFEGTGRWDQNDDDETYLALDPGPNGSMAWRCQREKWSPPGPSQETPVEPCAHLRVLLEWVLDWLHFPDHEFHAPLTGILARPAWERVLDNADRIVRRCEPTPSDPSGSERDRELAWRVGRDPDDGALEVIPIIRTRGKSGRFGRGRKVQPVDALEEHELLTEPDERALRGLLSEPFSYRSVGRVVHPDEYRAEALTALVGHPRVFQLEQPTQPLDIVEAKPGLCLTRQDERATVHLRLDDHPVAWEAVGLLRLGRRHLVELDPAARVCRVARLEGPAAELIDLFSAHPPVVPPEGVDELIRLLTSVQPYLDLDLDEDMPGGLVQSDGTCRLRLAPIGETGLEAWLKVRPVEGGPDWPPGQGPARVVVSTGDGMVQAERKLDAEQRSAEGLQSRLELGTSSDGTLWHWRLTDPDRALTLLEAAGQLSDELAVEWPADDTPWRLSRSTPENVRVRLRKHRDWFQLEGELEVDGEQIPLADLLARVRRGERFVRLGPGRFVVLGEQLRARLGMIDGAVMPKGRNRLGAGASRAVAIQEALSDLPVEADEHWAGLQQRLQKASRLKPRKPRSLTGSLRPYQAEGYRWLARLSAWASGACLADDMGLGKTIQALALLLRRAKEGPALVVAPSSVGSVWLSEAGRFAPSLARRYYHGPDRDGLLENLGPGDLVVTSYDVLARDAEALGVIAFSTLVLDEAQYVKNARSKRSRAVRQIEADFRLAMTGTPLENHLGELFSVFRNIDPGLLGSWEHFRERFAAPIERNHDMQRRDELVRLLRPFLLRRTKSQVAPELPPRTEVVRPVELNPDERRLYRRFQQEAIEGLAERDADREGRFALLAAITRLRRLACHPRLVQPDSRVKSSKLEAATALIDGLLAEGQRALVFSQFTSHLALVREVLDGRDWGYLYLDGATPVAERARLVERWATGQPSLFLISLKAGGSGLNLTGADAVIHLDPWWNPAVEDQATDRTHRIGQTRPVTVVRLIAQQTIEEAVLELHAAKRELASGLLEGADGAGKLSSRELLGLLRFGQSTSR